MLKGHYCSHNVAKQPVHKDNNQNYFECQKMQFETPLMTEDAISKQ